MTQKALLYGYKDHQCGKYNKCQIVFAFQSGNVSATPEIEHVLCNQVKRRKEHKSIDLTIY